MWKVEMASLAISLMLVTTPTVADVTSELTRCKLEAERLYPAPPDKGAKNWADRAATYKNGPRVSKRACGRPATALLPNVLLPSRPTKAV